MTNPKTDHNPTLNKYELIIASAREARRLNDVAKMAGRELKIRPTELAWDRLHEGKVNYTYEAERLEEPGDDNPLAPPTEEAPATAKEES